MIVYLSGAINGVPDFEDVFAFHEGMVLDAGYGCVNPVKVNACLDGRCGPKVAHGDHSHACYLKHDLKAMLECDAVAAIDGWQRSWGARVEIQTAMMVEMPIFHDWMNISFWETWAVQAGFE